MSTNNPHACMVRGVVTREVPQRLGLTTRTRKGVWSDHLGEEMKRKRFRKFTPNDLLDLCASAADATGDRVKLLGMVRAELAALWASLMQELPLRPEPAE